MPKLEDIFTPEWDYLLIERERPSNVLAAGRRLGSEDEYEIVAPDTSRKSGETRTGRILLIGPDVPPFYAIGHRAIFSSMGGTKLSLEHHADGRELWLLSRREVFAVMDGDESDDTLAEDWPSHMSPPPGKLLVERCELPITRGRIIIPDGVNLSARSNEALVVAVGPDVTKFQVGDGVYLAESIGKFIPINRDKRRLYLADLAQILGRVDNPTGGGVIGEQHPLMGADTLPREEEDRLDEGDPRLPQ